MAPMRNATTAVRTRVTMVKRLDIELSHYKVPKLVFVEDLDAELLRFFEFAPRLGAGHHIVGFLTHRPRNLCAVTLQRLGRFLARHRAQRAGEHERLPRQRTG